MAGWFAAEVTPIRMDGTTPAGDPILPVTRPFAAKAAPTQDERPYRPRGRSGLVREWGRGRNNRGDAPIRWIRSFATEADPTECTTTP